jgi:S-adenosylmethionine hydrolase
MDTRSLSKICGIISVNLGFLIGLCSCSDTPPNENKEEIPLVSSAEFKDGGAYGSVLSITEEYGNINTEFIESDLKMLGIEPDSSFLLKYKMNVFEVHLGENYDDVGEGDWIAIWRDGRLRIARNLDNAAMKLGCKEEDILFVGAKIGNEE